MRERRQANAISFVMGCLVGGYVFGTTSPSPPLIAVVVSTLALAVPPIISVGADIWIRHRVWSLLTVTATSALLGGLLIASAAHPEVWQSYSSDATWISVLGAMFLAPVAAAFAVGAPRAGRQPLNGWQNQAIACGVLAWAGVGLQAVVLPYVVPFVLTLFAVLVLHQPLPTSSGGWTYGWVIIIPIVLGLIVLYVAAFALAVLGGLLGGALRTRL
jgi:hypothetical protein